MTYDPFADPQAQALAPVPQAGPAPVRVQEDPFGPVGQHPATQAPVEQAPAPQAPPVEQAQEPAEPEPVLEAPVMAGGTIKVTIPVPATGTYFEPVFELTDAHLIPAWVQTEGKKLAEQLGKALTATGLLEQASVGGGYAQPANAGLVRLGGVPAAAGAGMVAGTGASALQGIASGQAAPSVGNGMVSATNVHGEQVIFPDPDHVSDPDFASSEALIAAVQVALEELGVHPAAVKVWDNRRDAVSGRQQLKTRSVGRVVLSENAAAVPALAGLGKRTLAWVTWDTTRNWWKVAATKDLTSFIQFNAAGAAVLAGQVGGAQ